MADDGRWAKADTKWTGRYLFILDLKKKSVELSVSEKQRTDSTGD